MDGITIRSEMGNEAQVIHTYTSYSDLEQIILAQRSESGVKLTSLSLSRKPRTVYLPGDAMTALVKLWGATRESDAQAELDQAKSDKHDLRCEAKDWEDWYHTVSREAICLRAENEALRSEIARMESQESFRMALLESVVSAARMAADAGPGMEDWLMVEDALTALDAWQPDDASTNVGAAETHPKMPSLAYVHTQTVIENQRMKAVVNAAAIITASFSEGLMPTLGAMNELRDAVDSWQEDATRAMLSDDAEDMSADEDPDPRDAIGGLMDDPSNFQR